MSFLFTPAFSFVAGPIDPYWGNVALLLDGDGTNGQTTFTDESSSPHTITTNGNTQVDTAVKKFGTGSIEFDGSGDTLSVTNSTSLDLSSGDWTIECWAYHIGQMPANVGLFGKRAAGALAPFSMTGENNTDATKALRFYGSKDGSTWGISIIPTTDFPIDQWVHFALTRAGDKYTIWQNGVDIGSATVSGNLMTNTDPLTLGLSETSPSGTNYWNGYIDDFRITKGVARYSSNFTPPTSAFPTQ